MLRGRVVQRAIGGAIQPEGHFLVLDGLVAPVTGRSKTPFPTRNEFGEPFPMMEGVAEYLPFGSGAPIREFSGPAAPQLISQSSICFPEPSSFHPVARIPRSRLAPLELTGGCPSRRTAVDLEKKETQGLPDRSGIVHEVHQYQVNMG